MTIKEVLDSGNIGLGFGEALGIKAQIGTVLTGAITEQVAVAADVGVLANKALVIQSVQGGAALAAVTVKDVIGTAAGAPAVAAGQAQVAADQTTLTFFAADAVAVALVTYVPVPDVSAEFKP
jgi:hypothetical protein